MADCVVMTAAALLVTCVSPSPSAQLIEHPAAVSVRVSPLELPCKQSRDEGVNTFCSLRQYYQPLSRANVKRGLVLAVFVSNNVEKGG